MLYDFSESREHEHLFETLWGFDRGLLVGDGYKGYDAFAKARSGVVVAGCWAHVLRKFRDALVEAPLLAASAMTHIGKLFDLEKKATDDKLSLEVRLDLRRRESAKVIEALDKELLGWRELYCESGQMGTACKYFENQIEHLRVLLDDARVPIHNNACEVAIRPVAVGRRNWLFAGSPRGGRAAATIYTLIESCKRAGVDPQTYLADALTRVATHSASTGPRTPARTLEGPRRHCDLLTPALIAVKHGVSRGVGRLPFSSFASSPPSSSASSSLRISTRRSSGDNGDGHLKVPRSNRFAHTQMPDSSTYSTLSRFRRRLQKTKRSPDFGSPRSAERTTPLSPSNDFRMSVGPDTRNTRRPAPSVSIATGRPRAARAR